MRADACNCVVGTHPDSLRRMAADVPDAHELAGYFLAAQHPATRRWVDDQVRLELLTEQRADDVLLATDLQIAELRRDRFAPDQPAEALLNRWVTVTDDLAAMLSMRYEGGDPTRPFVDATVLSRPVANEDLAALTGRVVTAFGTLGPTYLRLWSADSAGHFADTVPDKRFLAAPILDLRAGQQPVPAELSVARAQSLDGYELAQAAYADVDREHSGHPEQAALQDADDLEESMTAGTLFDVMVDGEWAGLLAATPEGETLGLPAYVVQELVLDARFRGRGHGAHLTTLLARALPDASRVLLGTIHADNRGALQAAQKAGRVDVGGWFQVPLGTG